jgi:hypothetical protein
MRRLAVAACMPRGTSVGFAISSGFFTETQARNFSKQQPTLAASDATNRMLAALMAPHADTRRDSLDGLR